MDYQPQEMLLMFEKCDTKSCLNVEIEDNNSPEFVETFMGILKRTENLDNRIILQPNITNIEILDNDGKLLYNWLIIAVIILCLFGKTNNTVLTATRTNAQVFNYN